MSRDFSRETIGAAFVSEGGFLPTPTTPVYRTYDSLGMKRRDVAKIYEELMRAKPKVVDEEEAGLTFKLDLR